MNKEKAFPLRATCLAFLSLFYQSICVAGTIPESSKLYSSVPVQMNVTTGSTVIVLSNADSMTEEERRSILIRQDCKYTLCTLKHVSIMALGMVAGGAIASKYQDGSFSLQIMVSMLGVSLGGVVGVLIGELILSPCEKPKPLPPANPPQKVSQ